MFIWKDVIYALSWRAWKFYACKNYQLYIMSVTLVEGEGIAQILYFYIGCYPG